jgi:ABC-2 type transport system ATP-binding protein
MLARPSLSTAIEATRILEDKVITDYAIETASLEKIYRPSWRGREVRAVMNLSLRVPAGVKYALLGPNGAGKTTFVKMLLSAVHPSAGWARLYGTDSRLPEARRPVGYLPENHRFPTYLTGYGMLDFYGALSGLPPRTRRERIPQFLELVGLANWGPVRIKKYSKGMLQRLGLAQALLHHPKLLILDEPTDGVDPAGRREIREILNRLASTGVTIFINSHLLSEVESFCEYVAMMRKGELVLEGKISDLLGSARYSVTASNVSDEALNDIRRLGAIAGAAPNGISIQSPSLEHANLVIDKIRAAGGFIENVSQAAGSLEELFLQATAAESISERAA